MLLPHDPSILVHMDGAKPRDFAYRSEHMNPPTLVDDGPTDGATNNGAAALVHVEISRYKAIQGEGRTSCNLGIALDCAAQDDIMGDGELACDPAGDLFHGCQGSKGRSSLLLESWHCPLV